MNEIITERLLEYKIQSSEEELNAIKEITQEIILYALSKTKFFDHAYFCGGTALRIVHGLNRFSEDLDFDNFSIAEDTFAKVSEIIKKQLELSSSSRELKKLSLQIKR